MTIKQSSTQGCAWTRVTSPSECLNSLPPLNCCSPSYLPKSESVVDRLDVMQTFDKNDIQEAGRESTFEVHESRIH